MVEQLIAASQQVCYVRFCYVSATQRHHEGVPELDIDDDLPQELDLPDGVVEADDAIEVLRAWVADGALHVIFDPETFHDDVSEWGRLLADVAQHVANAVELDGQMNRADALSEMYDAFERHVRAEQSGTSGRIKGRTEH